MVTIHKFEQLPPHVGEAMAIVSQCLPEEPCSEDHVEEVPIEARVRGVTRPVVPDADTTIAELDMVDDEDEEALLAMARRLKRARRV